MSCARRKLDGIDEMSGEARVKNLLQVTPGSRWRDFIEIKLEQLRVDRNLERNCPCSIGHFINAFHNAY